MRKALVSEGWDFWLLGGFSLLVWAAIVCAEPFRQDYWALNRHLQGLAAVSAFLSLFINYPHFMASFYLAYRQGPKFMRQHPFQLVVVPLGLLGIGALGYLNLEPGSQTIPFQTTLEQLAGGQSLSATAPGELMVGGLVNLMYLTVGWHYAKQAYGCVMVQAAYQGYPLTNWQRHLIRLSCHSVWLANYTHLNQTVGIERYYGIPYLGVGIPEEMAHVAMGLAWFGAAMIGTHVVLRNHRLHGLWPKPQVGVAYLAFLVWWVPPMMNWDYLAFMAPLFHSLQYLPFVYVVVQGQRRAWKKNFWVRQQRFLLPVGLFLTGFLSFELVPNLLDLHFNQRVHDEIWFFFAAFHLFINIHHFFIDNTLWRLRVGGLREHLGLSKA